MRRLTGKDAYHVYEESAAEPLHTLKIVVLEPAPGAALSIARIRQWLEERAPRVAALRLVLVRVPGGMARPVWIDGALDVGAHVARATVQPDALDALASELLQVPLPRDRPLWRVTIVDGLADGRVALVFQLHHALADGVAAVHLLEQLFGAESTEDPPAPEPMPSALRLLVDAAAHQCSKVVHVPALLRGYDKGALAAEAARPFQGPPTPFNQALTARRIYADVTVPLADLQRLKGSTGHGLHVVYLALCGGALRRYLQRHGPVPDLPMVATVPASFRQAGELQSFGNKAMTWFVTLGTHIEDPRERLAAVARSLQAARDAHGGGRRLTVLQERGFVQVFHLLLLLAEKRARQLGRPIVNAVVSNVRGPRALHLDEHPVVAVRSVGPLTGRIGVNFTAWSYEGAFSVSIHACADHAPDAASMAGDFRDELALLLQRS